MKTTIKTSLSLGRMVPVIIGDREWDFYWKWDNPRFEKSYESLGEFLVEFEPNTPSDNLARKIEACFEEGGEITYKPRGYKGNMWFRFKKNN